MMMPEPSPMDWRRNPPRRETVGFSVTRNTTTEGDTLSATEHKSVVELARQIKTRRVRGGDGKRAASEGGGRKGAEQGRFGSVHKFGGKAVPPASTGRKHPKNTRFH